MRANIMNLGVCFIKKCTSSKLARLLDTASKFALFLESRLKDEKLTKKQTYTKTETCKLYSRVKIDPYNFEAYRFKVCAFFLRHSVYAGIIHLHSFLSVTTMSA